MKHILQLQKSISRKISPKWVHSSILKLKAKLLAVKLNQEGAKHSLG